ncbi:MAG: CoA pyrophosphatase [Deltaproteobacteria bacterium]|nr:CoA pyrophosphatase [Deltaproteobacteria bacterium]
MSEPPADPGIFTDPVGFPAMIVDKLGRHECDFPKIFHSILEESGSDRRRVAGVLLPLRLRDVPSGGKGQFVFQLIKRSPIVPQPGDLSLPGGMLHPFLDRVLRPVLIHGPLHVLGGTARRNLVCHNASALPVITLFLTTALRESWEEIRLSPASVRFLGPLPTYSLTLFRSTIFPLVGFVNDPKPPRPNREVEKVVEIPLATFYREEQFGCYQICAPDGAGGGPLQFPCLIHRDSDGTDEVLWGATFHIIVSFLEIVMGYRLPDWRKGPLILRSLNPDYLTGRRRP